eukprot:7771948-Pyramimonas_sp.AAC.1
MGAPARGRTVWDWCLSDFFGCEWYLSFDSSAGPREKYCKHLLTTIGMQHLLELFVLPRPPGGRFVKAAGEVEREMNERISKRIAANYENETEWGCESIERLGMKILGGSKMVIN